VLATNSAWRTAVVTAKASPPIVKLDNQKAVVSALTCLRLFDIDFPARPSWEHVHAEYETVWQTLDGRPIESDLPLAASIRWVRIGAGAALISKGLGAQLSHESESVHQDSRLLDLFALQTIDDHPPNRHSACLGGNAKKLRVVGPRPNKSRHHFVRFGDLLLDGPVHVWEGNPHPQENLLQARKTGRLAGEWRELRSHAA
jgi:hypothetical protein